MAPAYRERGPTQYPLYLERFKLQKPIKQFPGALTFERFAAKESGVSLSFGVSLSKTKIVLKGHWQALARSSQIKQTRLYVFKIRCPTREMVHASEQI